MGKAMSLITALVQFNFSLDFTAPEIRKFTDTDILINSYGEITDSLDPHVRYAISNIDNPDEIEIYYFTNYTGNIVVKSHNCKGNAKTKIIVNRVNDMIKAVAALNESNVDTIA